MGTWSRENEEHSERRSLSGGYFNDQYIVLTKEAVEAFRAVLNNKYDTNAEVIVKKIKKNRSSFI